MDEDGSADAGAGFELGDEPVGVVDVFGAFDFGEDDDVDGFAGLGDGGGEVVEAPGTCLLYTSPSPRDKRQSRMPSSA